MINKNLKYTHENDGVDHINIFSKGKTELGRMLSHFYLAPFIHSYFGPFQSMEGLWYYVRAEQPDDKLRMLHGHEAKFYGKELKSKFLSNFHTIVIDANYQKIVQNDDIKKLMIESTLPFDHYYIFGNDKSYKQVKLAQFEWLIDGFESIRTKLKNNETYVSPDYAKLLL